MRPKTKGSFDSDGAKKAGRTSKRGKDKKTLILDAMRSKALAGVKKGATNDEVETVFFGKIAERAFNDDDPSSAQFMKMLIERVSPALKPSGEKVNFDFDSSLPPCEKADQIIIAASDGIISPEVANIFISSIASMLKIEEVTELRKEVEEIKKMLGIDNG